MASPDSPSTYVRPAHPDDAEAIGACHVAAWQATLAPILGPKVTGRFDVTEFVSSWRAALEHQAPDDEHALLVAIQAGEVVGFTVVQPAVDPDSEAGEFEMAALLVDPPHWGQGHGSRLLTAAADTARELGGHALTTWVIDGDDARASFLRPAGLGPDGAWRETEVETDRTVIERRFSTTLG